jgi:hypothetical protein
VGASGPTFDWFWSNRGANAVIIAKWSIKPGCEQEAVTRYRELTKSMQQAEPCTTMYQI